MITAAGTTFEGPLTSTDSDAIAALRDVLARHGFAGAAGNDVLGAALAVNKSHLRDDLPLYLRRLAAPTPINTLAKLFMLDRWVGEKDAAEAVRPLDLDRLRAMGLIEDGPAGVRARVRLSAHEGLIIAHDAYDEERRTLRPDHVLDVNPTTMTLAHMTVRRQVGRALEIGTGCGVLALKAAAHAGQVVATDTNPRALNLAVFNAAINGITNVEWRQASLFDAVAGERFDLIFCNPPYVISPDSKFIFRDGGRRGDALCEEIIRRIPEHLRDGGFATVLINWVIRAGEEWSAPLRRWVGGNGCDSWMMMSAGQEPLAYAALWNRSRDRAAYEAGLERWTAYFEELAAQTIGLGAIVLRRRAWGTPWLRADHIAESVTAPAGPHIERLFDAETALAAIGDDTALLAQRVEAARDHRLHQALAVRDADYVVETAEVRLQNGLPVHGSVDAFTIQLLARCDGRRTLGDIASEIATAAGIDVSKFSAACAGIARRLISSGFLVLPIVTSASGSPRDRQEGSVT